MKRWVVVLLVLLALVVLVSPGIVGRLAEHQIEETLGWADLESDDVAITRKAFDRAWFTSEGRYRIGLTGGELQETLADLLGSDAERPIALIVETHIDHGLVPFTSMSREAGSLRPGLASAVSTLQLDIGGNELIPVPGRLYSQVGLSGQTVSRFVLEAGSFDVEGMQAEWEGADITFTTDASGRSLHYQLSMQLSDVVARETGPFDMALDAAVHGLDASSMQAIIAAFEAARTTGDPDTAMAKVYLAVEDEVKSLLSAGAQIHVDQFDVALPQGTLSSQLHIELPASGAAQDFSWPSILLMLTASAEIRMPASLMEMAQAANPQAGALIAMGFLKRDGDFYVMDAEYAKGLLTVNGAPMPIPMPAP